MEYLLDTNVCIEVIRNRVPAVRRRLGAVLGTRARVLVPSVASFELWYGVVKSATPDANARLVAAFLRGVSGVLELDEEDAREAGRVRAHLEKSGKMIGAYDVLIAGQALRRGMTLVTGNVREVSRVRGLRWEDWRKG
jgi:tRNA(fMet)-specific endonuclease VapC